MSNALFPTFPGQNIAVSRAPQFTTRVQKSASGRELRASLTAYPTYSFRLSFDVLRPAELQQLQGFFLARRGSFDSFLYTDPDDCRVTDFALGTGDGNRTQFQLLRAFGGFVEPVENVNAITNIKVGGVVRATNTYSVTPTGIVLFNPAPPAGQAVTWTGSFYFRCRFRDDAADFNRFLYGLYELKKLEFIGATGNKV